MMPWLEMLLNDCFSELALFPCAPADECLGPLWDVWGRKSLLFEGFVSFFFIMSDLMVLDPKPLHGLVSTV